MDSNRDKNSLEKIDQGSPALVALVAELCQLNKLIKNSVAYKTGAYKAHEEWLNAVRKNTLKLLQGVWSIDSDPLPKQPGGAFLGAIRSVGTHFNVAAGIEKPTMAPRN